MLLNVSLRVTLTQGQRDHPVRLHSQGASVTSMPVVGLTHSRWVHPEAYCRSGNGECSPWGLSTSLSCPLLKNEWK